MAEDRPLEGINEAVGRLDGKIDDAISTLLARMNRKPVGDIELAFRATAKEGTVFLQGQTLNRADLPALWAWAQASGSVVAGGYGIGNGTTTFTVPDMRGRVLVGAGTLGVDTYALGGIGGASTRALTTANMPSHGHNVSGSTTGDAHSHTGSTSGDTHSHTGSTSGGGTHGGHQNNTETTPGGQFGGLAVNAFNAGDHSHSYTTPNDTHSHTFTSASDTHSHTLSVTESLVGSGTAFDTRAPWIGINFAVWF